LNHAAQQEEQREHPRSATDQGSLPRLRRRPARLLVDRVRLRRSSGDRARWDSDGLPPSLHPRLRRRPARLLVDRVRLRRSSGDRARWDSDGLPPSLHPRLRRRPARLLVDRVRLRRSRAMGQRWLASIAAPPPEDFRVPTAPLHHGVLQRWRHAIAVHVPRCGQSGGAWRRELGWPTGGRQEVGLDRSRRGQSALGRTPVRQKPDIEQAYIKMPESSIER
jgi:hypothetical protein